MARHVGATAQAVAATAVAAAAPAAAVSAPPELGRLSRAAASGGAASPGGIRLGVARRRATAVRPSVNWEVLNLTKISS